MHIRKERIHIHQSRNILHAFFYTHSNNKTISWPGLPHKYLKHSIKHVHRNNNLLKTSLIMRWLWNKKKNIMCKEWKKFKWLRSENSLWSCREGLSNFHDHGYETAEKIFIFFARVDKMFEKRLTIDRNYFEPLKNWVVNILAWLLFFCYFFKRHMITVLQQDWLKLTHYRRS